MKTCNMVIIEDADLKYWWECSNCEMKYKDTRKFKKSKTCPNCGSTIIEWIGLDDYDDQ